MSMMDNIIYYIVIFNHFAYYREVGCPSLELNSIGNLMQEHTFMNSASHLYPPHQSKAINQEYGLELP